MRQMKNLFAAIFLVCVANAVSARHLMYVPDHNWSEKAWQCNNRKVSLIEVERLRAPTAMKPDVRIAALKIDGVDVGSNSVIGLDAFVASLVDVETITSRCGEGGESIIIFGFVHETGKPYQRQRREFFISYDR